MKKLLLLLLFTFSANAQSVYLNTDDNKIFKVNEDSTITLITTTDMTLNDIAIDTNGNFYGMSKNGEIVSINMQTGVTSVLITIPNVFFNSIKSLVCNYQNELFFIDNDQAKLYKYSIAANTLNLVTTLYPVPGDLTFYKGNLIFPGGEGMFADNPWIKAYDFQTGLTHTIFNFPENNNFFFFFGITNRYTSCGENQIIGWNDFMKQYNIDSNTTTTLAVDAFTNANFMTVNGLASDNEYRASNPECYEPLEDLAVNEFSRNEISLFPNPAKNTFTFSDKSAITAIEILDITGKHIKTLQADSETFDISDLQNGIYLLKINLDSQTVYRKLVKN